MKTSKTEKMASRSPVLFYYSLLWKSPIWKLLRCSVIAQLVELLLVTERLLTPGWIPELSIKALCPRKRHLMHISLLVV